MAALARFAAKQTFQSFLATCRLRIRPKAVFTQPALSISTSKKNKDSVAIPDSRPAPSPSNESLADKDENWVSYDYNPYDRDNDEWQHHFITFTACFALCWMCFTVFYYPDLKNQEWTQREAYLELARREKEGLPRVDRNLIAEDRVQLPTEKELEGIEIII